MSTTNALSSLSSSLGSSGSGSARAAPVRPSKRSAIRAVAVPTDGKHHGAANQQTTCANTEIGTITDLGPQNAAAIYATTGALSQRQPLRIRQWLPTASESRWRVPTHRRELFITHGVITPPCTREHAAAGGHLPDSGGHQCSGHRHRGFDK